MPVRVNNLSAARRPEKTTGVSRSLKNISVVAGATMVSRVLGLGRDILISAVFGTSALASSFVTAFTLPNLFRRLLGEGALTAAFVPTLNEELTERQRDGAFNLVSQVASWLLLVTAGLVGLSMWGLFHADFWAACALDWGVSPDTTARWLTGAELAVVLFPYMIFVCLAAAFSAALQTLDRFLEPALSPIWLNLAMIGFLAGGAYLGWADSDDGRMRWLCVGVLVGGFFQMAVPAVALMRLGWRPACALRLSPQVRAIAALMGPTVLGSAIYLINMAVSRVIGLSLNDAAASVLNLATRLMELPIGVFAVAVSTVIFPLITRHAAQGDWTSLASAYRKGMRLILVINIPAAVGLVVLAEPVIRLLFQRGAFRADDTALMVPVLAVYALGLPLFSFVTLVLRAFHAERDTRTPVHAAILSFAVNVGLSLALMGPLSTIGLAVAGNATIAVQAWFLQSRLTAKRGIMAFGHLGPTLIRILIAAVVMGAVVAGSWRGLLALCGSGVLTDLLALGVLIPLGIAVYGGLLWAMKIEGRQDLAAMIERIRLRLWTAR